MTSTAERFVAAACAAGCPRDQVSNFARACVVLQPRQLVASAAARRCDQADGPSEVGYGGARAGGKSHWMLAQIAADDCQRYAGLKCLILRKVGKALKEGFEDLLRRTLGTLEYTYTPSTKTLVFPNGSQIILGHFQREGDIDAYLGLEYDVIGIEEATTLSATKVRAIRTCNRSSKAGWRPRMYLTTNPGGIGHTWFKKTYIDPHRAGRDIKPLAEQTGDTRFVPATVDDNRCVNGDYAAQLDKLTGWQLRAWRHGDWDIAAGQFFTSYRREVHVIKPFALVPSNWRVWAALDYGYSHYTVCYLLAESDGIVYVLDEHAAQRWLVPRHATAIKAMLDRNQVPLGRLDTVVAGADVFATRHTGGTIADEYKRHLGITLKAANDDRVNGAGELLARLGDVEVADGQTRIAPRLFITERCAGLIETLPLLEHDPAHPERVLKWDTDDGNGGDDYYDAARYGVMAASSAATRLTSGTNPFEEWRG